MKRIIKFMKNMTTYGKGLIGVYILLLTTYFKFMYLFGYKKDGVLTLGEWMFLSFTLLVFTYMLLITPNDFHKNEINQSIDYKHDNNLPYNVDELDTIQAVCVITSFSITFLIPLFYFLIFVW